MVSIMKFWTPLLMAFLCMMLPSVLGGIAKPRPEASIAACWGEPKEVDCALKCSRNFFCLMVNYTCCWTYCGNICWRIAQIDDE
ncbi:unnamed protein product [Pipistrellus nathusii]|uniref:Protein WFDC9 n=1 Tax=Pipistrellus nathusii TaxID=59473 RepID=A0ABP0ABP5_PIPNA